MSPSPTAPGRRTLRPGTVLALAASAVLAVSLLAAAPVRAGAGDTGSRDVSARRIPADDADIVYVGRWSRAGSDSYTAGWAGPYLRTAFTGTTVKAEFRGSADIYVSIDGGPDVRYLSARGTVDLTPSALPAGRHSLRIAYRSGDAAFRGLLLDPGATVVRPETSPALLEFVGDSITVGTTDSQLTLSSYGWLTGERLHTEHTHIAKAGACLVATGECPAMETRFFRADSADNAPAWDFSRYQPDVVVINLGTNDAPRGVPADVLRDHYTAFLHAVRTRYPRATVLALQILRLTRYTGAIREAVAAVHEHGDRNVHFVATDGWLDRGDYARDGVHPNDAGQRKFADRLTPVVARYLAGWGSETVR